MKKKMFDFIIIGSGAAGSVLANRLTENPFINILLVEYGDDKVDTEFIKIPFFWPNLLGTEVDWCYETESEVRLNGRKIKCPRGKILGGSTSINAMNYIRGSASDYNNWEKEYECKGWSYQEVLPYFKKSENQKSILNDLKYHGYSGPLHVCNAPYIAEISKAFLNAGIDAGYKRNLDFNGEHQEGFGVYQKTIRKNIRESAYQAFLKPILGRPNLHILIKTLCKKILFDDNKNAIGISVLHNGEGKKIYAEKEVILCAGAINSPQILMLSGIGPKEHLKSLGINVIYDSPNVGKNLQDHPFIFTFFSSNNEPIAPNLKTYKDQFNNQGHGPLTVGGGEVGAFIKTDPNLREPDVQIIFMSFNALNLNKPGISVNIDFLNVQSEPSYLLLKSSNPLDSPIIFNNYFKNVKDLESIIKAIRIIRKILKQPSLQKYQISGIQPNDSLQTDEEISQFILNNFESAYHFCGTCKMGNSNDSVVDTNLLVRGVNRLRVIDASIIPKITSGNTQAPVYMIAEKGADLIKLTYNI
jgi:choline dehydrogenase